MTQKIPYRSPAPLVTLLVPVFNNIKVTLRLIQSLEQAKSNITFSLLVVDDASYDQTHQILSIDTRLNYVRNKNNIGFLGAVNRGLDFVDTPYVCLLNNDVIVHDFWIDRLVEALESDADIGAVGPKILREDGMLSEAGGLIYRDGSAANYGRGLDPARPQYNYRRAVDYISGAAVLLRTALFRDQLSGFDRRYAPAYYEDTDLAMELRRLGYRVVFEPSAVVTHTEGVSNGTTTSSGTKKYQALNQHVFSRKWRKVLDSFPTWDLARADLDARKFEGRPAGTVVFIDDFPNWRHSSGGLRAYRAIRELIDVGHSVVLIATSNPEATDYLADLQRFGVEVFLPGQAYWEYLRTLHTEICLFWLARVKNQPIRRALAQDRVLGTVPVVYDSIDLHFLRQQRELTLRGWPNWMISLIQRVEKSKELRLFRSSAMGIVVSTIEKRMLVEEEPTLPVTVLSNVHELEVDAASITFKDRHSMLFVGNFRHPPNSNGLKWFLDEVLPRIQGKLADLPSIQVVGSPPPVWAKAYDGVEILGHVRHLGPLYEKARVALVPLRFGAGVKGKVGEAWSYGVPTVGTGIAYEGMLNQQGRFPVCMNSAEDFATEIARLFLDDHYWLGTSRQLMDLLQDTLSPKAFSSSLRQVLAAVDHAQQNRLAVSEASRVTSGWA